MFNIQIVRDIWRLITPYFKSTEKWRGLGLLLLITCFELAYVGLNVALSYWNNYFYNSLQTLDYAAFITSLGYFVALVAVLIAAFVIKFYFKQLLQIRWRTWLTSYFLGSYFTSQAYYGVQAGHNQTDNPDQRIAEDIKAFISQALDLFFGFLNALVTLCSFIAILWSLSGIIYIPLTENMSLAIPGYMVFAAILYSLAGTWFAIFIGRPLISLQYHQERFEASFRFALARIREHVEAIAFHQGEEPEHVHLKGLFKNVISNFRQLMMKMMRYNWFINAYNNATTVFPILMAAPRFFTGAIKLGDLMQIANVFGQVQTALSFIVSSYPDMTGWIASAQRLRDFNHAMLAHQTSKTNSSFIFKPSPDANIYLHNLKLQLPNGQSLLALSKLTLQAKESLLITGVSGLGKSTLLRAIAGIWQYGSGEIAIPSTAQLLFLPQKPYLPLGTLLHSITYPQSPEQFSEDVLAQRLTQCGLAHLIVKFYQTEDWSRTLSLGEQQRLNFVRALLQSFDWIFLDEATSSVDETMESYLYQLLLQENPHGTIVSVGHRSTLQNFHARVFDLSAFVHARGSDKSSIL